MLKYLLTWSGDLYGMKKATIPAIEHSGLYGHGRCGKLYVPDMDAIRAALPARYRAAFDRADGVWFDKWKADAPAVIHLLSPALKRRHTLYLQPLHWGR